ncbi:MAG: Hsp20/alpha crystallin family protein [Opitutaceae bacterium]
MHTIIHPLPAASRKASVAPTSVEAFRQPAYDCQEQDDVLKLVVYTPGVAASGVEIEARGADLTVTARKKHFVRVNWQALHLENAQRDYRLRLRLGNIFDYGAMAAEIFDGVLTITLPKRQLASAGLRRVA